LAKYEKVDGLTEQQKRFYALITNIDENIGLLDQTLYNLKIHKRTILIFTTDNGSGVSAYNNGLSGYKSSEFDGGHRVPFYLRWPDTFGGGGNDINHLSGHIDILPTLMDKSFCNLKYSFSEGRLLDGLNLAPVLLKDEHISRFLVVETQRIETPRKWLKTSVMMNDEENNDWRLLNKYISAVSLRLYNMATDRKQQKDLTDKYGHIKSTMESFYDSWWADVTTRDNEIPRIHVGGLQEVSTLTAHDWMGTNDNIPYEQRHIQDQKACFSGGYWPIYVEKSGKYSIRVLRWPLESRMSYTSAFTELMINERKYKKDSDEENTFIVDLKKGNANLKARFITSNNKKCDAYYVYIGEGEWEPEHQVVSDGYEANWDSLKSLPIPEWLKEGKFGIFIHWGAYSVVGKVWDSPIKGYLYSEWLPHYMYRYSKKYDKLLKEYYGTSLTYAEMIERFTGDNFDAKDWVDLFKASGAKYVVSVAEHHDGFAMWDSDLTEWNAKKKGPNRDIIGEIAEATRSANLKFGVSFHRERHYWYYNYRKAENEIKEYPNRLNLYGPEFEVSEAFVNDYRARINELVEKYNPEYLWMDDITREKSSFDSVTPSIIADFVNHAFTKGLSPYLNNKSPTNKNSANFPNGVGLLSQDNLEMKGVPNHMWENAATLGISYGFSNDEEENNSYRSVKDLIWLLVDTVSKNGVLLLNVGPKSDGTIAPNQRDRLVGMGKWLELNRDAIYGSSPWHIPGYDNVRFTVGKKKESNILYVIMKDLPKNMEIIKLGYSKSWSVSDIDKITLVSNKPSSVQYTKKKGKPLEIILPTYDDLTFEYGIVLEIELRINAMDLKLKK